MSIMFYYDLKQIIVRIFICELRVQFDREGMLCDAKRLARELAITNKGH